MKMRGFTLWVVVGLSIGQGTVALAEEEPAGIVLAVQGTVTMQPATMTPPVPLRQFDEIGRLSILDSQPGSRCKVLYADDSLLTLGDNSRLEVMEQSYEAGGDQRAFVAHLARGTVRALVARQFELDGDANRLIAAVAEKPDVSLFSHPKPPSICLQHMPGQIRMQGELLAFWGCGPLPREAPGTPLLVTGRTSP